MLSAGQVVLRRLRTFEAFIVYRLGYFSGVYQVTSAANIEATCGHSETP